MLIRAIENRFCFDNLITDGCIETLQILFCESALQQIFRLIILQTRVEKIIGQLGLCYDRIMRNNHGFPFGRNTYQ